MKRLCLTLGAMLACAAPAFAADGRLCRRAGGDFPRKDGGGRPALYQRPQIDRLAGRPAGIAQAGLYGRAGRISMTAVERSLIAP